jgi:hypothetical protein
MTTTRPWVIDRQPSRRFPVYTRGNSGEVFPNVMTPMTGSLIGDASIPAIVGVADATNRLADGQTIEIDGATGIVTVQSTQRYPIEPAASWSRR